MSLKFFSLHLCAARLKDRIYCFLLVGLKIILVKVVLHIKVVKFVPRNLNHSPATQQLEMLMKSHCLLFSLIPV